MTGVASASDLIAAFGLAMLIATVTAPVGVSGAVFLLPVQVSLLQVPSPAVTPTNLLYNVIATPGAVARYGRTGAMDRGLALRLLAGTLPGVVAGAWLRTTYLADAGVYRILLALLLLPLGTWLVLSRRPVPRDRPRQVGPVALVSLGLVAGLVGGVLGIGGGSLVAPVLAGLGVAMARVAPAALAVTLATSVVGVAAFVALAAGGSTEAAPDWLTGVALGLGGLIGGYAGARLQPHLPERLLRLALGGIALAVGLAYLVR